MDPAVSWFQREQDCPAKLIWLGIWESQRSYMEDNQLATLPMLDPTNPCREFIPIGEFDNNGERAYYNPSRRKMVENRASTYNMNKHYSRLIGKYGGCPWRVEGHHYGRGVFG